MTTPVIPAKYVVLAVASQFFDVADQVRARQMAEIAARPAPQKTLAQAIAECDAGKRDNLFNNNFKIDQGKALESINNVVAKMGIKAVEVLSDHGTHSFVFRTDKGTVLRICGSKRLIGKPEPKRANISATLQPLQEIVLDKNGDIVEYSADNVLDDDNAYIYIEEIPQEPVELGLVFKELSDRHNISIDECKQIISCMYFSSIDEGYVDIDTHHQNIVVTEDYSLLNLDSGSIVSNDLVSTKKISRLTEFQESHGYSPELRTYYRDCLMALILAKQLSLEQEKMLVLEAKKTPVIQLYPYRPTGTDGPT